MACNSEKIAVIKKSFGKICKLVKEEERKRKRMGDDIGSLKAKKSLITRDIESLNKEKLKIRRDIVLRNNEAILKGSLEILKIGRDFVSLNNEMLNTILNLQKAQLLCDIESLGKEKIKLRNDIALLHNEKTILGKDIELLSNEKAKIASELELLNKDRAAIANDAELRKQDRDRLQTGVQFPKEEKEKALAKNEKVVVASATQELREVQLELIKQLEAEKVTRDAMIYAIKRRIRRPNAVEFQREQ